MGRCLLHLFINLCLMHCIKDDPRAWLYVFVKATRARGSICAYCVKIDPRAWVAVFYNAPCSWVHGIGPYNKRPMSVGRCVCFVLKVTHARGSCEIQIDPNSWVGANNHRLCIWGDAGPLQTNDPHVWVALYFCAP